MLQFRLAPNNDYHLVHLEGLVSLDAWQQILPEIKDAIGPTHVDRLVLDLMGLLGWLGIPERRAVGGMMAVHFAHMKKVALVIQAHKITDVVKAEARQHGLDLRLFSSFNEAVAWVTS